LFWKTFKDLNYNLPKEKDFCFIFELFTPENSIVVQTKESKLYLHGCRNLKNFKEEFPEIFAEKYNWQVVEPLPLKSLEEVLEAAKKLNPIEHEGYVVCDSSFNRVKIKVKKIKHSFSSLLLTLLSINRKGKEITRKE
jgi:hypothetical protein